jgi:hypothetical protein
MKALKQDQAWIMLINSCERSMQSISEKVVTTWPNIRFQRGHHSNPAFPARFWGSFTNSLREDIESIDISIDFRWGIHVIEATADVAYESGKILSELPVYAIPLKDDDSLAEDIARETAVQISDYIQEQWELIGRALQV